MLETIVRYLLQGLPQVQIASIVGCTPGYVSQVKDRPDFDVLCQEQQAFIKASAETRAREKKYEDLEDLALEAAKSQVGFAEFSEITRLLDLLNKRKAPALSASGGTTINNDNRVQTVVIQIPQVSAPEIRLNSNKEVIGIDNQSLAPMGAHGVKDLFKTLALKKQQRDGDRVLDGTAEVVQQRVSAEEM